MSEKTKNRERLVMERLATAKKMEIAEAMALLGVSESTVRRLFNSLEAAGGAIRTHGGIALVGPRREYSFEHWMRERPEEKTRIGARACREVGSGEQIYLDCGTTVLAMCIQLARRIQQEGLAGVQLFTNSLANVEVLAPVAAVNLVGGLYRPGRKDFAGYLSERLVREMRFSRCFVGTDGVDAETGFTATDMDTASLNRLVMENSGVRYVLCDSTKMGKGSLVPFAPVNGADYVVTDSGITAEAAALFAPGGAGLVVV